MTPLARIYWALFYELGQGVTQNYPLALKFFQQAADKGNLDACNSLGLMYYRGEGVPRNYPQAYQWFKKSADKGDARGRICWASFTNMGRASLRTTNKR